MQPEYPTLLAALVAQDERTQEEIITGYEVCARQLGEDATLSLRTFRRWMVGDVQSQPRPTQRRVARQYWGHGMSELLAPPPLNIEFRSTSQETALVLYDKAMLGRTPHGADIPQSALGGDSAPDIERQVAMATRRAARFTAFAEASNVGSETLDQLRDEASILARNYMREPINAVVGDLVEFQDTVFTLLEGKQKPTQTRDLYLLAGVATGMLAKVSHDLGRSREAMTQARTLYVCADNAGHLGLRAWARGLQSLIAYWAGRPEEAVHFAKIGGELAAEVAGSTAAWLPALEARAWAQLSDTDETRRAIQLAAQRREHVVPDDLDALGGLLTFPQAKQHYYVAGAYVFLDGEASTAQQEAGTALNLYEAGPADERSFSDEAGSRAELALARVIAGEVDGAREVLAPVLQLRPEQRIGGIVASAARVHNALRDRTLAGSPVARAAREEIEAFCQAPLAALPR